MTEHQQPYAESVGSDDFEDTNSQTISTDPSSPVTVPDITTSTESTSVDDTDDNGLSELVSSGGEELLKFVDEIRQIDGLNHVKLDLPQLVVVGNTSSGKSSLLQAITKLPFPVGPELCTHFATETIIKRCRSRPSYTISVRCPSTGEALYPDEFPKSYTGDKWPDVCRNLKLDIKEAFLALKRRQVPSRDESTSRSNREMRAAPLARLQEDIMTIEVEQADQAHFSVVDIPGLVSNAAEADVKLSEKLAKKYIRNKRAIPLAVLSAVDAFDNQKVLRLIREAGASSRCLGVITKCDQVQERDDLKVLDVLKRPAHYGLDLGCYAVKNRSTKEIVDDNLSYTERDERERSFFFDKEGWQRRIDSRRVGVDNLRASLAQSLYKQVVSSFPDLREDIRATSKDIAKELRALGEPRSTPVAQRYFLQEMQSEYQGLIKNWLAGTYLVDVRDDHPSKIWYHVMELYDRFDHEMRNEGLRYAFINPLDGYDPRLTIPTADELRSSFLSDDGVYAWIIRKWATLRGPEAPRDTPPHLKQMLFEEQTSSWAGIAEDHLDKVIQAIDGCNSFVFERVCPDLETRHRLREKLYATESSAKTRAEGELQTLLHDHAQRLHTKDPRLNAEIEELDTLRMKMCLSKVANQGVTDAEPMTEVMRNEASIRKQVYEIHDYLKAYCGIAMSRFIDNVAIQVVERHLLGKTGPLAAFTSQWISGLTDEQLESLVGEKTETRIRRAQLSRNLEVLKEALGKAERLICVS